MQTETSKGRASRIDTRYYETSNNWRMRCAIVIGGLTICASVIFFFYPSTFSPGPVSSSHQQLENDCATCHTALTPVDAVAASSSAMLMSRLRFNDQSNLSVATSSKCKTCHQVSAHSQNLNGAGQLVDQNCAICHPEHKGSDSVLTLVDNNICTSCHGNSQLNLFCVSAPQVNTNISKFSVATHQFEIEDDPGKIRFNHQRHMLPGQRYKNETGGLTLSALDPSWRERYKAVDDQLIQLRCGDCHEPDGTAGDTSPVRGDHEVGRYMSPIRYEDHCSACHPIISVPTKGAPKIPHGIPWSEVELLLSATIEGAANSGELDAKQDQTPLPGTGQAPNFQPSKLGETTALAQRVKTACHKCHETSITEETTQASKRQPRKPLIPARWYQRGLFHHDAHRWIDCSDCHDVKDDNSGDDKDARSTVLIPGFDKCAKCHSEAGNQPTNSGLSQASSNCVDCHRYHPSGSVFPQLKK